MDDTKRRLDDSTVHRQAYQPSLKPLLGSGAMFGCPGTSAPQAPAYMMCGLPMAVEHPQPVCHYMTQPLV
jgi:hypothetical protein